eukprot:GHVO01038926.1.p1 GENE.GHVO01038926.1~~GHVO01038926.1.p1  ORF type:complete len:359 (+),score=103.72 GHVO01038926.1:2-1078(+)
MGTYKHHKMKKSSILSEGLDDGHAVKAMESSSLLDDRIDKINVIVDEMSKIINGIREDKEEMPLLAASAGAMSQYVGTLLYTMILNLSEHEGEHDSVDHMTYLRRYMDVIRPMEKRVSNKIEKEMEQAKKATSAQVWKPSLDEFVASDDDEEQTTTHTKKGGGKREVYKPPQMLGAEFTPDNDGKLEKERKRQEREMDRLRRSEAVQIMREDTNEAPEEVYEGIGEIGDLGSGNMRSKKEMRLIKELQHREAYEFEHMKRIETSKGTRKALQNLNNTVKSRGLLEGASLDQLISFADDAVKTGNMDRVQKALGMPKDDAGSVGDIIKSAVRGKNAELYQDTKKRPRKPQMKKHAKRRT